MPMKLVSFEVGPYRNVLATGPVQVRPDVTVLVGKNESGKTNLLHALHALNPADTSRDFPVGTYPQWLQKRHQKSGEFAAAKPIQATFRLEQDDLDALVARFGEGVFEQDTVIAYRKYGAAAFEIDIAQCNSARAIRNAGAGPSGAGIDPGIDLQQMRENLLTTAASTTAGGEPTEDAVAARTYLEKLSAAFGEADAVSTVIAGLLRDRVPQFFYFDNLHQLPGTTDTAPLIPALNGGSTQGLTGEQLTALALLRMGQANADIIANDYEPRKNELQAVGVYLTQEVLDFWKQSTHLSLLIDINPVEQQGPSGPQIVRRELKLDVLDDRHHFTNSLDARSSGFRWFVSFIAAFTQFQDNDHVIVLLDEPALSLHARAQADMLRFINDRLAKQHQVLYTTHSPFMVERARLERVRIVEDTGPTVGTKVSTAGAASTDPDTLFPLQAALGYDIAQNIFIGPDNLAVEGLSDFTYLTVLSDHLASLGRAFLDPRWRILPVGGATNLPTFISLLGQALDVTVLADTAEAAGQKVQNLILAGLLASTRLITPAQASPITDAETEDLFNVQDYLHLYNATFNTTLTPGALTGTDRITKRISRAIGTKFTDHNKPANHLLHHRDTILRTLTEPTLAQFETLIQQINQTLRPHPAAG
jgi:predicted ATPase